jgi:hypothetical protein
MAGAPNLGYGIPGGGPAPNPGDAPQGPNSPFTMVMRPNAPANDQGGRGGGGTPLGTALDLSSLFNHPAVAQAAAAHPAVQGALAHNIAREQADPRARAQAPPAWKGLPQVQKGGVAVTPPTFWNPATGGATVGLGN